MGEKILKKQQFSVGGHEELSADLQFKTTWLFPTPAPVSPDSNNRKMTKPSTWNYLSEKLKCTDTHQTWKRSRKQPSYMKPVGSLAEHSYKKKKKD